MQSFNGLGLTLGSLSRLSNAETWSLSAENPTGAKGQGGRHVDPNHGRSKELGTGWKVRPCVQIKPGETLLLACLDGPGARWRYVGSKRCWWQHLRFKLTGTPNCHAVESLQAQPHERSSRVSPN